MEKFFKTILNFVIGICILGVLLAFRILFPSLAYEFGLIARVLLIVACVIGFIMGMIAAFIFLLALLTGNQSIFEASLVTAHWTWKIIFPSGVFLVYVQILFIETYKAH
jgi:hypothetical protein